MTSIRGRALAFVFLAFLPLVIALGWHEVVHRNEKIDSAIEVLKHQTELLASQHGLIAATAEIILTEHSLNERKGAKAGKASSVCSSEIALNFVAQGYSVNFFRLRENGAIACSTFTFSGQRNFSDQFWFREARLSGDMVISNFLQDPITHETILFFAKSLDGEDGVAGEVVALSVNLTRLENKLFPLAARDQKHLILTDSTGEGVLHLHGTDDHGVVTEMHPVRFNIPAVSTTGTTEIIGQDGSSLIYGFAPVFTTVSGVAYLWIGANKDLVLESVFVETLVAIGILLTIILVSLGTAILGSEKFLLGPLQAMGGMAMRFGAGDHAARTGLSHDNTEVGQLAQAFDLMAETISGSESRFQAAVEASLDAIFILKSSIDEAGEVRDFRVIGVNGRAGDMFGKPRETIIGQNLCDLLPIIRTNGVFDSCVTVATTGTAVEDEFTADTPEIKADWLRFQAGKMDGHIVLSLRDVTHWKEMTKEQTRLAAHNRLILDSMGDGIFGVDLEGRATFVNPRITEMLQWTEEDLLGQNIHALCHHSTADGEPIREEDCPVYATYKDGVVHSDSDSVSWCKDGTSVPVSYVSTPIEDNGTIVGAVVTVRDITERKQAEHALARVNRALETLSKVNMTLVRSTDEAALLKSICQTIVNTGHYCLAWIGYARDDPEQTIEPKAWAGIEDGRLDEVDLVWGNTEAGRGPIGQAIRSGEPQVINDLSTDPVCAPRRAMLADRGSVAGFVHPMTIDGGVIGVLAVYTEDPMALDEKEVALLTELGNDLTFGIASLRIKEERNRITYQHRHHAEILQKALDQSIQAIAGTVDARDPYTAGHQRRVAELATAIARMMELPEDKVHGIYLAGIIHDLGKIQVPAELLSKPSRLSETEFALIKNHPQAGYDILKSVEFPWPIADIVRQHHEKLDGSGYPQGLKGGQILLESRIMTVADVVEAMSSHRPYRPALGIDAALKEIEEGRGKTYDPAVVDTCLTLFREKGFEWGK